jgi:uridylate kinase
MTYVLSVGGSLIVPQAGVDTVFLKSLRRFVVDRFDQGDRLIIVTGGGATARNYVKAASAVEKVPVDDQDWLGIHATRLNAHLVRTLLKDLAHPEIITNPNKVLKTRAKIILAGGYRPGSSSDYVSVLLAKKYKAKTVINLSNIDYVYDKDPSEFETAKKIERINWEGFKEIVGDEWTPGMNAPFDPIASRLAQELKLKVAVLNGKKLDNVQKFMDGKKFIGTLIAD